MEEKAKVQGSVSQGLDVSGWHVYFVTPSTHAGSLNTCNGRQRRRDDFGSLLFSITRGITNTDHNIDEKESIGWGFHCF
jgi:hypothetical protein